LDGFSYLRIFPKGKTTSSHDIEGSVLRARRNAGKIKFSGRFSGVAAEAEGTQSREQCRGQKKINAPFTSLRNASDSNGRQQSG
jgi:hypothetical protein